MTVKHKRKNALTHARPRSENRDRAAEKGPYDADADDAPAPSGRPNKWPLPSELGGPPPPQNPTAGLPAPVGFASVTPLTPSTYTLLPAPPIWPEVIFLDFVLKIRRRNDDVAETSCRFRIFGRTDHDANVNRRYGRTIRRMVVFFTRHGYT